MPQADAYILYSSTSHLGVHTRMSAAEQVAQESSLPQELVDYVLEMVVDEWRSIPPSKRMDREISTAVRSCMLVSRTFLSSVRRYLFAHVHTHEQSKPMDLASATNEDATRMNELWKILKKDPLRDSYPLAAHIRSILVEMDPLLNKDAEKLRLDTTHRWLKSDSSTMDWNSRRMNMREVLRTLPNLNAFALQFKSSISGHALHVGLSLAIEKLCQSPLLTSLHFENIHHFSVDILASCTNLRQLRLVDIYTGDVESGEDSTPPTKYASTLLGVSWSQQSFQHLESLDTELSGDVLEYIKQKDPKKPRSSPPYFSNLKTLKLGIQGQSGPDSLREVDVMRRAAGKLEAVTIRGIGFDVSLNRFPGRISLGDFKVLRILHLKIAPSNLSSLFRHMPRGFDPLLGTQINCPTTLEKIIFDFATNPTIQDPSSLSVAPSDIDPCWATIDSHLNDRKLHPLLGQVTFRLQFVYRQPFGMFASTDPDSGGKDKGLACLLELADRIFPRLAHSDRIKYTVDIDLIDSQDE